MTVMSNKSDREILRDANSFFNDARDVMRRRGVHEATPTQVLAWIEADKKRKEKKERKERLDQERSQLPMKERVIHFIKHLF